MESLRGSETEFGHLSCKILGSIPETKFKNDIETESVYKKLEMITERRLHRPLYYQVMMTMYAAILFKAGPKKRCESLKYLREVLANDETNITALSDLVYIYRYISDFKKASNYETKLNEILRKNDNLSLARAYYDKAHIIRHFEQDKRKFSYFEFLKKSKYHIEMVDTTEGSIDTERGEILFDYSLSLYRKYYQKVEFEVLDAEIQMSNEMLDKAIGSFIDVIEIAKSPSDCRALSYIFIAILLRLKLECDRRLAGTNFYVNERLTEFLSIDRSEVLKNNDLLKRMRSECLERGLNLAKDDSNVLRRVASEYTHLNRLEEAEEYFEKSILKEKSWFAYRHQGILYLKMYELDTSEKKEYLLDKAKDSFMSAYEMKETHADLSDSGYICMLQGKNQQKQNRHDPEAISYFNEAKMKFADAVKLTDCDDYFNPIETYKHWGECLQLTDETQGRGYVRKMSIDHEKHLRSIVHSGYFSRNQPSNSRPIFKTNDEKHSFYVIKSKTDYQWVIEQLLPKLEGEYNQKGFLKERDKILGHDFIAVLVEAIRISKYIVVMLSKNFESCSWCQYELNLALNDAILDSRTIIPIMLEEIDIPLKLQPICEDNLIKTDNRVIIDSGWDKLRHIFKNRAGGN